MGMIFVLTFLGVFAAVALPVMALGLGPSRKAKQVIATLDSALATERPEAREQVIDFRKDSQLSSIPWLNRKLRDFQIAPYLHRLLEQADLSWSPSRLFLMCVTLFAVPAYLIYLRSGSLPFALIAGALLGAAPFGWVLYKRSKRFNKFRQGLPEALDLMVSGLRAGHSLIAAMGLVARECPEPVGAEFRTCFDEQNYGLELKAAMENLIARVPLQELRIVSTAIMIQRESGGNLAEVLDKTAHCIRESFRLKRQVMVHTAQGRMTGLVLTLLPVVVGGLLFFINPQMMSVLWTRELGIKLLWTAGGMMVVGGLIIRKIVNMDV